MGRKIDIIKPEWPPEKDKPWRRHMTQAEFCCHVNQMRPEFVIPILFKRSMDLSPETAKRRFDELIVNLQLASKTVCPGDYERACKSAPVQPLPLPDPRELKSQLDRIEARLGMVLQFLSELNFYVSYYGKLPINHEDTCNPNHKPIGPHGPKCNCG